MINVSPTKNLLGVTITGDYNDLCELVESIYLLANECESEYLYSITIRMFAVAYDLRHAYQGDREVKLVDNGMNRELMDWHNVKASTENVYYSCNIFFPQIIFFSLSASKLCDLYGTSRKIVMSDSF